MKYKAQSNGDAEGDLDLMMLGIPGSCKSVKLRRGITMNAGAERNVMPRKMVQDKCNIRLSDGSKQGGHYIAASNGRIPFLDMGAGHRSVSVSIEFIRSK